MPKAQSMSSGKKKLVESEKSNLFQIIDYMKSQKVSYVKTGEIEIRIDRFDEPEVKKPTKIDPLTGESDDILFWSSRS